MDLKLKIYITDEQGNKFFGIGVMWLLEHIKEHGSLKQAAEQMGVSYSKAYRMLDSLEQALENKVLVRQKGGAGRKGAYLTEFGVFFLDRYSRFQQEVKEQAGKSFQGFLAEMKEGMHGS